MQHTTYTLDRPDQVTLVVQRWQPDGAPKASIVLCHGFGEHVGRYGGLVDFLTGHGYAIDAADDRGHGQTAQRAQGTPTTFGYFDHFQTLVDDLDALIRKVAAERPTLPLFLVGHSMGGLLALENVLRYPGQGLRGLVVTAPYVNTAAHVPVIQKRVIRLLSRMAPRTAAVPAVSAAVLSHDPAVVSGYDSDPLVLHGKVTARVAVELLDTGDHVRANASQITLPTLVLHGTADQLALPEFGQTVYDRLGSPDKTIKLYDGFYHEILNETGKAQVMADVLAWLDRHLG